MQLFLYMHLYISTPFYLDWHDAEDFLEYPENLWKMLPRLRRLEGGERNEGGWLVLVSWAAKSPLSRHMHRHGGRRAPKPPAWHGCRTAYGGVTESSCCAMHTGVTKWATPGKKNLGRVILK